MMMHRSKFYPRLIAFRDSFKLFKQLVERKVNQLQKVEQLKRDVQMKHGHLQSPGINDRQAAD